MNFPKNELAQLVIAHCVAHQIEDVVISPGSRNAPLIIGFKNHPKIKTYSIVDERCAAFFALGIAQQKRQPVCVVCTSGSALLNYYPAFAEAFYSNIPLVVISADRPKYLIDIGDGQTIRQENVFKNHSLYNANLVDDANYFSANSSLIKEAFTTSIKQKGPVHINVPFDEPLYETVKEFTIKNIQLNEVEEQQITNEVDLESLATIWNISNRKMILIGEYFPDKKIQQQLEGFVEDESVIILTETTSNIYHNKFFNSIDKLIIPLDTAQFNLLQPDVLLTFGGMVVSKKIKQFLRQYKPKHHWHIDLKNAPDTFHCLNQHIQYKPQTFLNQFKKSVKQIKNSYQKNWLEVKKSRDQKHTEYLSSIQFSDLKVFDLVFKSIPDKVLLQLGNSSVIRYSQLFNLNNSLQVFCNRGTSGIDGSTSTAIGSALISTKQTVFITGDLSFFYDSNALWNSYIKNDFRIIVINNSGGGIFRFIPGPSNSNALDYFEASHNLTAEHLCNMYNFEYAFADTSEQLINCLDHFYDSSKKPKLLEIFTPKDENDKLLKEYFKFLK